MNENWWEMRYILLPDTRIIWMGNKVGHFNMKYWNKRDYILWSHKYTNHKRYRVHYWVICEMDWYTATLFYHRIFIRNYVTNFKFFWQKNIETFCIRCSKKEVFFFISFPKTFSLLLMLLFLVFMILLFFSFLKLLCISYTWK